MAGFALLFWPVASMVLFAALGPARGLIWSVMAGYLFLPEGYAFSLRGLPEFSKASSIAISALLPSLIFYKRVAQHPVTDRFFRNVMLLCLAILLTSSYGTYVTNQEVLVNGTVVRRGLKFWDAVSMTSDLVIWLMPMVLAWRFLRTADDQRHILLALVALGLAYSLLVLFEVRMSPQLNKWVYGYFPHSWRQHLRGGSFRPIVFLRHGLWLGFFLFTVVIAALALSRDKSMSRPLLLIAAIWATLVLILSRNLGATLLAFIWAPVILFTTFRMQARLVAVVAVMALSYPLLSQASLTPAGKLLEVVSSYSPDRARSFQFRLDNESLLLARAMEKPVFGWGGYSRQRLYDENGRDQTLTDGLWIVAIGQWGWVGFLTFFGLLCIPLLFLGRAARRKELTPAIAGLAVITAGNLIYLIPNSTLSPIALLIVGAIAAFVQFSGAEKADPAQATPSPGDRQARYTRFANRDTVPVRRV